MRIRRLLLLPMLVGLVAAMMPLASAAHAAPPPDGEPSLFVVRAPIRHDDGVLSVRTRDLEWFTDRPDRDAGTLTAKQLVEHWPGWGFADDPPNAALRGDDVDAIGELSAPKIRGGNLQFDFEPIRGELADGSLGTVALFIDPTSTTSYQLTMTNNSTAFQDFVVYQTLPESPGTLVPLAWFVAPAWPNTTVTFQWDQSYQFMVSGSAGGLKPGVTFDADQTIPADPESLTQNSATLTYDEGVRLLLSPSQLQETGTLQILTDGSIPSNVAALAFGQAGAPVFAALAAPNASTRLTPAPKYWIAAGTFTRGQVLDVEAIANTVAVPFSGVTSMSAVLDSQNNWVITQTP